MKLQSIILILGCLLLAGCDHYNYAVKRASSPIPYKNLYDDDDNEEYEFHSTLYKVNSNKKYLDYVEITHLNDIYNHHHGTPANTWKKSRLNFMLSSDSGVELIPDSVTLQHFSNEGKLFKPNRVESTLNECRAKVGCRGRLILYYPEGMPESLTEKVSFTINVQGTEKVITYTIPLVSCHT